MSGKDLKGSVLFFFRAGHEGLSLFFQCTGLRAGPGSLQESYPQQSYIICIWNNYDCIFIRNH